MIKKHRHQTQMTEQQKQALIDGLYAVALLRKKLGKKKVKNGRQKS